MSGLVVALTSSAYGAGEWQKIDAPPMDTVEIQGEYRDIQPSCAFDGNYHFYYKEGKSDKVVVYFNGGGACWNDETCVDSLNPASGASPSWVPTVNIPHNDANAQGGLFEFDNPDNPYSDWTVVFLPYCTGDIHFGSKTRLYNMTVAPGQTVPVPVRHHGFDNFLYVRSWLAANHDVNSVGKILVAGSSAGAYGALFNYPYLREITPNAKGFLLADAGNGVISEAFVEEAFWGPEASWGIEENLPTFVPGISSSTALPANSFYIAYMSAVANNYPKDKFGQFTNGWDVIQVLFKNIMDNPENISEWSNLTAEDFIHWNISMLTSIQINSTSPNYKYYVAPGCNHTLLRDSVSFYADDQVDGISFLSWMEAMTKPKQGTWENVECEDCSYLTDPEKLYEIFSGAGACLERSM